MNKITAVCKHCGSTFTLMSEKSHTNASVCDDCKTVIQREYQREHWKEARAKKRRERAWNNISEDIISASRQKITYGQYMAKRRLSK